VAGIKTFSSSPVVPTPSGATDAASKGYTDTALALKADAAATTTSLGLKADASTVVKLTTDQTVAGIKTFSSSPVVPTPSGATDAASKGYTDTALALKATDSAVVKLTGTQTVTGAKTFTNPTVINGTASGQARLTLQHIGSGGNQIILTTSAGQWLDYMEGDLVDRHFSDPFGKDHMLFSPATGTGNGLTTFNCGLKVVGNVGFYNVTPVAKAGATADIKASLVALGLITGAGATPLNLGGGTLTAGTGVLTAGLTLANEVYARNGDATNQVKIGYLGVPAKAGVAFGSAEDAYIYRSGAGALVTNGSFSIAGNVGFYGTAAVAKPTGVAVTAAGVHAALVTLGLIAA
jgi:hypothetical protein